MLFSIHLLVSYKFGDILSATLSHLEATQKQEALKHHQVQLGLGPIGPGGSPGGSRTTIGPEPAL
jgi:hypothetical protein